MAGQLHMGHRSYGDPLLRGDMSDVYVGKYCSIAQGVRFDCGMHHNMRSISTFPFSAFNSEYKAIQSHPVTKGDIHIGNDVWIGEGAIIMGGVAIGSGAVIGAGCIVTHDVLAYQVVAGSPMEHIRMRFDEKQIYLLLQIKWWDWPDEKIEQNIPLLMSNDFETLFKNEL